MLKITEIRTDGGTQARVSMNWKVVADYAALMHEGAEFPAVVVFHDKENYWLADGFHRLEAARRNGVISISAKIEPGTKRDAILYSVGANSKHGLPPTNADKRQAIFILLTDKEWAQWSDRELARQCGVASGTVNNIRKQYFPSQTPRLVKRNSSVYRQKVNSNRRVKLQADNRMNPKNVARRLIMFHRGEIGVYEGMAFDVDFLRKMLAEIEKVVTK
jgi:hypothetical protein